jgi:hypothetical protein
MLDPKYLDWKKTAYQDLIYWQSPDKVKIAYRVNGRVTELTWKRWVGGGVGPKPDESNEDYISRRFSGSLKKKEVKSLAFILEQLEDKYKQKLH